MTAGAVTLPSDSYVDVVAGLRYTADYTSNKLTQYVPYSVTSRRARVVNIALLVSDMP